MKKPATRPKRSRFDMKKKIIAALLIAYVVGMYLAVAIMNSEYEKLERETGEKISRLEIENKSLLRELYGKDFMKAYKWQEANKK